MVLGYTVLVFAVTFRLKTVGWLRRPVKLYGSDVLSIVLKVA